MIANSIIPTFPVPAIAADHLDYEIIEACRDFYEAQAKIIANGPDGATPIHNDAEREAVEADLGVVQAEALIGLAKDDLRAKTADGVKALAAACAIWRQDETEDGPGAYLIGSLLLGILGDGETPGADLRAA